MTTKRILITGGTGFIGQTLVEQWLKQGHDITLLTRRPNCANKRFNTLFAEDHGIHAITHFEDTNGKFDWIINLAGEGIADKRWNKQRKQILRDSRIKLTNRLCAWIKHTKQSPECIISGSAIGIYSNRGDEILTEQSEIHQPNKDFAAQLCTEWEQAAHKLSAYCKCLHIVRTGLVLGAHGGMLSQLWRPFSIGAGGRLGNGQQFMSWVHLIDYTRAIQYLLNSSNAPSNSDSTVLPTIVNITAPNPVRNAMFTQALGQALKRPTLMPIPAASIRLLFGEMGALLLGSQRVMPSALQAHGFQFQYTDISQALEQIVNTRTND